MLIALFQLAISLLSGQSFPTLHEGTKKIASCIQIERRLEFITLKGLQLTSQKEVHLLCRIGYEKSELVKREDQIRIFSLSIQS